MLPVGRGSLLAIKDGPEDCNPRMYVHGQAVPMHEVAVDPMGKLYLDSLRPYDAMGDHICYPTRAVGAMLHLCRQWGRIGLAHRQPLVRLVRMATRGKYFFSRSYALLECMLGFIGNPETERVDLPF